MRIQKIFVAAFVLLGGCSLLVDTSPYVGAGADGGPDGSVDASVDPNGPTAPVVRVVPASPATTDDLTVEIVTESTDPLDVGPVTYEYRWLRDGSPSGEMSATVPASSTAKAQVWRIEVTPVSADSSRRGAAGTAEVTIGNLPPTLATVGFDSYFPIVGERLSAVVPAGEDADGDRVSTRFAWYRNEVLIPDATAAFIETATFAPGDTLRLEATPDDGDAEGAALEVGPVSLLSDETRWRALLPNSTFAATVHDVTHQRLVTVVEGQAWEVQMRGVELRAVRLPAGGIAPPGDARQEVFHDAAGQRLLVVTADQRSTAYVLDLSRRGRETWSTTTIAGSAPVYRHGSAVWYDETNRAVWAYGGLGTEAAPDDLSGELWRLDLTPGSEQWARIDLSGPLPPLWGACAAMRADAPGEVYLAGGAGRVGAGLGINESVYRMDVASSVGSSDTGATTTTPGFGCAAASTGGILVFAGGSSSLDGSGGARGVFSFDAETGSVDVWMGDESAAPFGVFANDAEGLRFLGSGDPGHPGWRSVRLETASQVQTVEAMETRPPGLSRGVGNVDHLDSLRLVGGRVSEARMNDSVWVYDLAASTWTVVEGLPDAVSSTVPNARWGIVAQPNQGRLGGMFLGGRDSTGALADFELWELSFPARWLWHSLRTASPSQREGVAVTGFRACGRRIAAYFGGENDSGTPFGDAGAMDCVSSDFVRECEWEPAASSGGPSPRSYSAIGASNGLLWVFGGRSASGASSEVFHFDGCAASAPLPWTRVVPSGPSPSPRYAHSMAWVEDTTGGPDSFLVYGGTDGSGYPEGVSRLTVRTAAAADWAAITPVSAEGPPGRAHHVGAWDEARGRLLVYGGERSSSPRSDFWELRIRP